MLTHIRVKNFKSWADSGEVVLAPLTGFFGTNSSGKSSLLQLLLLLKQSIGSDDVLFFGDASSLVNLGSFGDVIHGHDTDASLALEYGCKPQEPVVTEVARQMPDGTTKEFPVSIRHFTFNISVRGLTNSLSVESFRYGFNSREVPDIQWKDDRLSRIDLRGIDWRGKEQRRKLEIRDWPGSSIFNYYLFEPFTSASERQFSHVYYLGPARITPQRRYHWEGTHPHDTGLWGDKTVDALLSSRVLPLKASDKEDTVPIEEQISKWLHEMEFAHSFSLDLSPNGDGRDYEVRIKKDLVSPAVTLADMGYGLSQFLPVLVLCYYAPEGSTLILEQPGIHLHPKVQSQLADLLIEVVTERNLQVLVESHSEHLLNRLQRRIAEEQISVDKTSLYFCRNQGGVSACERLEIDEFGNIANWPENFFGNEMGDLLAMAQAQMERQKRVEA